MKFFLKCYGLLSYLMFCGGMLSVFQAYSPLATAISLAFMIPVFLLLVRYSFRHAPAGAGRLS